MRFTQVFTVELEPRPEPKASDPNPTCMVTWPHSLYLYVYVSL